MLVLPPIAITSIGTELNMAWVENGRPYNLQSNILYGDPHFLWSVATETGVLSDNTTYTTRT